jgi:hypothetical protein
VKRHRLNVFINAPFDDDYAHLFDALIFTVYACGYRARCALEENDSGDIRLDKLSQLISASPRSIHDLSRVELGENELPRFNMPFELGMALGAKRFGGPAHRADRIKIMVADPYRLPAYLSDLGGNDPDAHHADPSQLIRIVRNFLDTSPTGAPLPGPARLAESFALFAAGLPALAREIEHRPQEIGGFKSYGTYLWCVGEFLKRAT